MKTATLIRELEGFQGAASLFRLEPPHKTEPWPDSEKPKSYKYVIVSAVVAYSGPETYIFPANAKGEVTDWVEMPGSYRGGLNHEAALANAGYTVVREEI